MGIQLRVPGGDGLPVDRGQPFAFAFFLLAFFFAFFAFFGGVGLSSDCHTKAS